VFESITGATLLRESLGGAAPGERGAVESAQEGEPAAGCCSLCASASCASVVSCCTSTLIASRALARCVGLMDNSEETESNSALATSCGVVRGGSEATVGWRGRSSCRGDAGGRNILVFPHI